MQDIMKRALFLLLATAVTVSAWAQERPESSKVLGKIQEVRGLVTVISGTQLINAVSGAPLVRGTRIASASSGGATFVYDNGCHIILKANESYLVEEDCDCGVMQAKVQEVGTRKPAARAKSPARAVVPFAARQIPCPTHCGWTERLDGTSRPTLLTRLGGTPHPTLRRAGDEICLGPPGVLR